MDRDKLIELIRQSGYGYFITHENTDVGECLANTADHLIANGIGDITTEKHRADVAEEALRLAIKRADISYFKCNYTKLCNFRTYECGSEECINIIMEAYKQEAEERLKKIGGKQ